MKYKITSLITMSVVILMAAGLMSNKTEASTDATGIKLEIKPFLEIERSFKKVTIVPGESEFQKREKANKVKNITASRAVVARERVSEPENVDLGSLRALYQEAASKYGIDPKLVESVHQVETGKSGTTCKRNPSGATGPFQFMPGTFAHYGTGDICNLRDATFAAANYLAKSGADRGDIDGALFNYNHSTSYVRKVKQVMESI